MARPTNKGLISKSLLTAIAGHIRRILGTSSTYSPSAMASALEGITRRTDSGNATLNRTTTSKSYAAGYYPNAHGAQHSLGTEGTPSASKSVSNHTATVTPSVTNTEGYIAGGTHSGTPVTVSPADLGAVVPSGTKQITANGTGIDVADYAAVDVSVPSKPEQTKSASYTANGTYDITPDAGYAMSKVTVTVAIPYYEGW